MAITTRTGCSIGTFTREWSKLADGSLLVSLVLDLDKELPRLARVGVSCRIPATYEQVEWYGRGPHEAYPDRKAGAPLGKYSLPIAQLEVPYIVPQEQGTRIDIRWLRLAGAQATPIKIEAEIPFLCSVVRHEDSAVWRARHTCELDDTTSDGGYWILNLDLAQRGVGTASCGPDTLPRYEVSGGRYENTFHCIF
ncbi:MAG: hypothetical protein CVV52_17680 [Spirochaetae bacterium HGW-Spirochaetae-8]|nr:MAG: hypothetical protein CVV52_17680 [Spirochaetae bacterium HGW-Spirochaetae-8]